ncbi:MAG TPA: protein-glutamate O-methyltransferase [Opitutaceae bacterium]
MRDTEFDFIRGLVYERSRINLGADKRELVAARLGKRLRATSTTTVGDYCKLLQSSQAGDELAHLIDVISTNHTFFFREEAHFDFLRNRAIPEMTARARTERWSRFYVWSAASSSGEEAYSIAMTLASCLPQSPWHIEGTDISHRILEKAAAGIYKEETVGRLPPDLIKAYFQQGFGPQAGNYRIKPALREHVTFQQLNLLEGDPAFREPFQVIFCRNVMIYFDRPTQEELVARLTRRLVPGGYLLVGHSESLTNIKHSLKSVQPAVYQRPLNS